MSGAPAGDDAPKTALAVADLSALDRALKKDDAALRDALTKCARQTLSEPDRFALAFTASCA